MMMTRKNKKKMPLRYEPATHIKDRTLAFVDLEFSGLEADNEILQIAAVMVRQPDFQVIGQWETRVKPTHIANGDKKSLKIAGYSARKWKDAIALSDALQQFNTVVKDAVLIGYNVVGDFFQLKKSYHQVGLVPSYHWQVLDVLSMIYSDLYRSHLDGYRMREVAKYFHLKTRHWHDALVDARATYEIFKKLMDNKYE